jgi:hypothetical protein
MFRLKGCDRLARARVLLRGVVALQYLRYAEFPWAVEADRATSATRVEEQSGISALGVIRPRPPFRAVSLFASCCLRLRT